MAEKKYIECGAVLADIDAAMKNNGLGYIIGQTMKRYIKRQPTADVVEVVHARWNKNGYCTYCGGHAPFTPNGIYYYESGYCQTCGAKMDGERKE